MQPTQKTINDRILFLDNIRYLIVLLVVVLHSASAYSYYQNWPVNDYNSVFFDYILRTLDIFLMPALFFIAGYFALPSLNKKNTWLFIKNKFKRLGIPWLIGVMLLGPVKDFIHYYSLSHGFSNLWNAFLSKMKIAFMFDSGFMASTPLFEHLHFWFISLLLFFFIVFALLHKAKSKLFAESITSDISEVHSSRQILSILLLVSIFSTLLTAIMYVVFYPNFAPGSWFIIGSVIQFQPTRISLYILCFGLGIYSFHKNWFVNGNIPGHIVFWTLLSLALWLGHEKVLSILLENTSPIVAVFYYFSRTLLFFSILLTFISFGERFWDSSSKVHRSLAKNSYNIYLTHMVFVYLAQLFLLDWLQLSIYIKFIIVSLSAIFLSYVFSRYALKPYPKLSVAGMIGVFAVLSIFASS